MRKIKLKAQVKPKCNCEDHYLELCTSYDGETFTYQRYCYKCGKWWTYSEHRPLKYTVFSGIEYKPLASKLLTENAPQVLYGKNYVLVYSDLRNYEIWSLDGARCIKELIYSRRA